MLDHEAIKYNHDLRDKADTMINEVCNKFKIYTYRANELFHEVVNRVNILDTCLKVAQDEVMEPRLSYEELSQLRVDFPKKMNKKLYYKFGDQWKAARAWLREYSDVEANAAKLWGHYKAKAQA